MKKTIAITGGTSGIGLETVKALGINNWRIILLARDEWKAQEVIRKHPKIEIDFVQTDLADLTSVKNAANYLDKNYAQLDVLMNNAGGVFQTKQETKDGFEMTMGVNHLSHFLLTTELVDLLVTSKTRIINISSAAHKSAELDSEDLNWDRPYQAFKTYANSKLANIYFTKELHRRYEDKGITAFAVHPGVVRTNFAKDVTGFFKVLLYMIKPFMITPRQGAATQILLATDEALGRYSGKYFEKKKPGGMSPIGNNETEAKKLWEKSEELVEGFRK